MAESGGTGWSGDGPQLRPALFRRYKLVLLGLVAPHCRQEVGDRRVCVTGSPERGTTPPTGAVLTFTESKLSQSHATRVLCDLKVPALLFVVAGFARAVRVTLSH